MFSIIDRVMVKVKAKVMDCGIDISSGSKWEDDMIIFVDNKEKLKFSLTIWKGVNAAKSKMIRCNRN